MNSLCARNETRKRHMKFVVVMSSCKTCCPTNDASPYRTVRYNNRRLDACRLATVSSRPRQTVRWDRVEIASSRTEEGDRNALACFWSIGAATLHLPA